MPAPFRRHPTRTITENIHGINVDYDVPDNTPVIRLPFNLDATLRRVLFTIAVLMTIGAIIWGTVAIGSMLTLLAPPWGAYLVAGVFDAGWAGCLIAEWILRYDHKRARIPAGAGVAMLAVSMTAIIIDGTRSSAIAVGIIGALVSAASKGMWAVAMYTIRIKLEPKYEAYLRTLQQKTGTEQALALGERDRQITADRTVRLKLALEARRGPAETSVDQVLDRPEPAPVHTPDQDVDHSEPDLEPVAVQTVGQPVNRPVQPKDQVAELHSRLKLGEAISKSRAAEILGIPESTAYRRLTEAKALLNQYR